MNEREIERRVKAAWGSHRVRAKEAGAHLDYTRDELAADVREALAARTCLYCSGELGPGNWSCDHEVPISRGGSFKLANVFICCRACNEAKGGLTRIEWEAVCEATRRMAPDGQKDFLRRLRAGGKRFGRKKGKKAGWGKA